VREQPALWKEEILNYPALRKTFPALREEELLFNPSTRNTSTRMEKWT
jgi:hypothetical protein